MGNKFKDFFSFFKKKKKLEESDSSDHESSSYEDNSDLSNFDSDINLKRPKKSFLKKVSGFFSLKKLPSTKSATKLHKSLGGMEKWLEPEARPRIHHLFLIALVFISFFTLGKITALVLRGKPQVDPVKRYQKSIILQDLYTGDNLSLVKIQNPFRTNTGLDDEKTPTMAERKCEDAQIKTNLPIKLVNTIVLQREDKSLASVQLQSSSDLSQVRIGEEISGMAKVFKIRRLGMVIKNLSTGMCELVVNDSVKEMKSSVSVMSPSKSREFKENKKKVQGIENEGNKFKISKNFLEDKLKDLGSILTQARAVKIQNPDGSLSFKMTELDPQGIFPYLGVQDQDIITSINGKPITDLNEVMGLFGRIKNLDRLQLGVKRDGTDMNLDYSINK